MGWNARFLPQSTPGVYPILLAITNTNVSLEVGVAVAGEWAYSG